MPLRELRRYLIFLAFLVVSVFVPAGSFAWRDGWFFVAVMAAATASVSFGVFRATPELAQERRTAVRHAKPWDRVLTPLMAGLPVVTVVLAGLGRRFGWQPVFPEWSTWPAFATMVAGSALAYWAMRTNRFFSSYVRIQDDRNHTVVDRGPYAVIRHPGYAGSLAVTVATPVLLNSLAGSVVALATALITVLRTHFEDRMLKQELAGYDSYSRRVRRRLLPLVW